VAALAKVVTLTHSKQAEMERATAGDSRAAERPRGPDPMATPTPRPKSRQKAHVRWE
jgi:hypothetical protein